MITTSERKLSLISLGFTGISLEFVKYIKETSEGFHLFLLYPLFVFISNALTSHQNSLIY